MPGVPGQRHAGPGPATSRMFPRAIAPAPRERRLRQAESDRQEWMSLSAHTACTASWTCPRSPMARGCTSRTIRSTPTGRIWKRWASPPSPSICAKLLRFWSSGTARRWLLLWGKNGNGKTGLMICLVKLLLARALVLVGSALLLARPFALLPLRALSDQTSEGISQNGEMALFVQLTDVALLHHGTWQVPQ